MLVKSDDSSQDEQVSETDREKVEKNDQVEVNVDSDRNSSLEQQEHPTKLTEKELDFGLKLLLVLQFLFY